MDAVRWGMIGCGDVTEKKSGPAFNQIKHSSLVAVMGRTPEKTQAYAGRHGIPRWYTSASDLVMDPLVNAVYIATPPDSHAEYTLLAAQAGKPVYVEKPMARTYAECQAMITACQEASVPLFVAYYRRCLPAFQRVKSLVGGGAIGTVRFISVRLFHSLHPGDSDSQHLPWRVLPEISGGGYFYDLGSHQLDFLDDLFGPVISAVGQSSNQAGLYPAEDIVAASWTHRSGVVGNGLWCFTVDKAQQMDLAEVVGSRGKLSFSFFEPLPVTLETEKGVESFSFPRIEPIQQPLIQAVVDDLRGLGICPSTGVSAARTNRVMEQILHSSIDCV